VFSDTCDGLCEASCQGAAGCRLFHEDFCGVGNDQQNETAELTYIFGGNEPDLEAPYVEIVSPADGDVIEEGGTASLRAVVDDDYGGYGWRFIVAHQGEVIIDQVDYDREVDDQYRAALNLGNLVPGTYEVTVEIADHFDHTSTDVVTFTVEGEVTPGTGGVDESGGSGVAGSDDGSVLTTGQPPDGTGTGDDAGVVDDDGGGTKGCACTAGPGGGSRGLGGPLALVGLWGLARRRSRDRRISGSSRGAGTRTSPTATEA
jgi:MYXO-CTERM domain-containing protein